MNTKLQAILEQVGNGRLSVSDAHQRILELFGPEKASERNPKEVFWQAFEKLKRSVNVEELLKISGGLVQQISESMPTTLGKLQENISELGGLGFCPSQPGIASRFSLFRAIAVDGDCRVESNSVAGSQWFGVHFGNKTRFVDNHYAGTQLSELAVISSDFEKNQVSLSRLASVTVQESRFLENNISRATVSDVSWTVADFEKNTMAKTDMAQTVFNSSRVANCSFAKSSFVECDVDACCWEFVTFDSCEFRECVFQNVYLGGRATKQGHSEPLLVKGLIVRGKQFSNIKNIKQFLDVALSDAAHTEMTGHEAVLNVDLPIDSSQPLDQI